MEHFALDGFWLLGAVAVAYLAGVFTSQYVKDKLGGVPSELRAAVRTVESDAKQRLDSAKAAAISSVMNTIQPHPAANPVPAAPVAPTPAAPAAPAPAPAPAPAAAAAQA